MVFVVSKCHSQWYCFFVQRREKHCTFALFCARYSCFWPQKLAQNPSESAFLGVWNLLFGSWMSPWIWSPGHKSKGGEGSFRSRWMYEFWDDNVCKWGCKYLHPGLQIFASSLANICIWGTSHRKSFCKPLWISCLIAVISDVFACKRWRGCPGRRFSTIFGTDSDPSQHRANPYGAGLGSFWRIQTAFGKCRM